MNNVSLDFGFFYRKFILRSHILGIPIWTSWKTQKNQFGKVTSTGLEPAEVSIFISARLLTLKVKKHCATILLERVEKAVDATSLSIVNIEDYGKCVYQMPLPGSIAMHSAIVDVGGEALEVHLPKNRTEE